MAATFVKATTSCAWSQLRGGSQAHAAAEPKQLQHVQVPMGAVVFCQPIEMRVETAAGFRVAAVNCWNYCPDYEGLNLASCRRAPWRTACALMSPAHVLTHCLSFVSISAV